MAQCINLSMFKFPRRFGNGGFDEAQFFDEAKLLSTLLNFLKLLGAQRYIGGLAAEILLGKWLGSETRAARERPPLRGKCTAANIHRLSATPMCGEMPTFRTISILINVFGIRLVAQSPIVYITACRRGDIQMGTGSPQHRRKCAKPGEPRIGIEDRYRG